MSILFIAFLIMMIVSCIYKNKELLGFFQKVISDRFDINELDNIYKKNIDGKKNELKNKNNTKKRKNKDISKTSIITNKIEENKNNNIEVSPPLIPFPIKL